MDKFLSIIIPVYKVEAYINKCLDSCIIRKEDGEVNEELMSKIDILIINDGTPDNSAEMSREYVKKYPQYFRQIDKENGGHGSVWNLGVKEAQGKYLKFLDSDDWLQNLDLLVEKLQHTNSDLILTSTRCHCPNNEIWEQQILDMEFYKSYDTNSFDWLGNRTHNYLLHHCCCYKTEIFRQYLPGLFLEKQPYDDVVLWPAAMIGGRTIEAFDFPLYNYLMDRPGQSISVEQQMKNLWAQIKTKKHTIEFYIRHPVEVKTTKDAYIKHRLPKSFDSVYRQSVRLPYKQGKETAKEWNEWVESINPSVKTLWIKLYQALPYCIYRFAVISIEWLYPKIKKSPKADPEKYTLYRTIANTPPLCNSNTLRR